VKAESAIVNPYKAAPAENPNKGRELPRAPSKEEPKVAPAKVETKVEPQKAPPIGKAPETKPPKGDDESSSEDSLLAEIKDIRRSVTINKAWLAQQPWI